MSYGTDVQDLYLKLVERGFTDAQISAHFTQMVNDPKQHMFCLEIVSLFAGEGLLVGKPVYEERYHAVERADPLMPLENHGDNSVIVYHEGQLRNPQNDFGLRADALQYVVNNGFFMEHIIETLRAKLIEKPEASGGKQAEEPSLSLDQPYDLIANNPDAPIKRYFNQVLAQKKGYLSQEGVTKDQADEWGGTMDNRLATLSNLMGKADQLPLKPIQEGNLNRDLCHAYNDTVLEMVVYIGEHGNQTPATQAVLQFMKQKMDDLGKSIGSADRLFAHLGK